MERKLIVKGKSLAGDATKLTIMKVMTTALTMLSTMLLSRFRTLEEYGTYSQLQLVITVVVTILMAGLPNSINYFVAKASDIKEQRAFMSVYYTLCTISGILSGVLLIILIPLIENYFNNSSISIYWYFLLLYPWTKIILSGIENILVVFSNIKKLIIFKILYSVITLGVIAFCWVRNISFYTYMIFFLATEIIFSIWVYKISADTVHGIQVLFEKSRIKEILSFSLPIGFSSIVGTVSIELDKMMIGYFYNTEELAIYTNASKEMPVTIVATSITAVLMPQLVKLLHKKEKEKAIDLWKNATNLSYICIAFLAMALCVFAPEVITILYSEKYLPGTGVFRVYSLVLLLRVTYFGIILNALGRTKFIFVSSLLSLLLNVILNWIGYLTIGFTGPAVATFVSIAVTAFIQLLYTAKVTEMSVRKIFPWGFIGKITLLNGVTGIIVYFLKNLISLDQFVGNIIETIIIGLIWGGLYLLIVWKPIKRMWISLNRTE